MLVDAECGARIVVKPAELVELLVGVVLQVLGVSFMTHYHDCARCRTPVACVCQTLREKILCLECWKETQQGIPAEERYEVNNCGAAFSLQWSGHHRSGDPRFEKAETHVPHPLFPGWTS